MFRSSRLYRIGYGYDSHRFLTPEERKLAQAGDFETETEAYKLDKPLIIGGVDLGPEAQKRFGPFKARSDGDVLYHAVVNGILSALALKEARDIGSVFPNTDKTNSHRDSADFLQKAAELLEESPYELAELKLMLKGKPRVKLTEVEEKLLEFFIGQANPPEIHLQGTSGEEMDAAGEGRGVEVYCVCLLQHGKLSHLLEGLLCQS